MPTNDVDPSAAYLQIACAIVALVAVEVIDVLSLPDFAIERLNHQVMHGLVEVLKMADADLSALVPVLCHPSEALALVSRRDCASHVGDLHPF